MRRGRSNIHRSVLKCKMQVKKMVFDVGEKKNTEEEKKRVRSAQQEGREKESFEESALR